ncbi:hypothetical protein DFS34DRAFT_683821 [Phlyctochytrium arcticum]|nr:hypothetical protein DFS34DRAFT_683821 [Phlyctochytrium arcticum]
MIRVYPRAIRSKHRKKKKAQCQMADFCKKHGILVQTVSGKDDSGKDDFYEKRDMCVEEVYPESLKREIMDEILDKFDEGTLTHRGTPVTNPKQAYAMARAIAKKKWREQFMLLVLRNPGRAFSIYGD